MSSLLRYLGYGAAGIVGMAGIGVSYIAATFDPNSLKPLISDFVRKEKQRELKFDGDIKLSLWPSIGVALPKVTLSEHNSPQTFLAIDQARLSLAIMPLLRQNYVIDSIEASGINATLVRNPDGSLNIADLLAKPKQASPPIKLQIGKIKVDNSQLLFDDRQLQQRTELKTITLKTGEVNTKQARGVNLTLQLLQSQPKAQGNLLLGGDFDFDFDAEVGLYAARKLSFGFAGQAGPASKLALQLDGDARYSQKSDRAEAKGLTLEISGDTPQLHDFKLKFGANADLEPGKRTLAADGIALEASGTLPQGKLNAKLLAPKLQFGGERVSGDDITLTAALAGARTLNADARLAGFSGQQQQLAIKQLNLKLNAEQAGDKLVLNLVSPVNVDLQQLAAKLPQLRLTGLLASPKLKPGSINYDLSGSASGSGKSLQLALAGALDQSRVKTQLSIADLAHPHYQFDVDADQLLLDRYLAAAPAKPAEAAATGPAAIDLSPLKDLAAGGQVRIGKLVQGELALANLHAGIDAGSGKLQLAPLSVDLFGGHLDAKLSATASAQPAFQLENTLSNVNVGQLLKTFAKYEQLEGRGNVEANLQAKGGNIDQLTRSLNGKARLQMRDGALRGINIGARLREAKVLMAQFSGQKVEKANSSEKTDFSELSATLLAQNGVIHNDDLSAKSPLLRLAGQGTVDLPGKQLDYLLKASVVGTAVGQDGRELNELKGVTLPVRIKGPLATPGYALDFANMLSDSAKASLQEQKAALQQQARQQLDQGKQQLQQKARDQLQNQLQKLLGK